MEYCFFQTKGNKDHYVHRILDSMKEDTYTFCTLGRNAYTIALTFSERYQVQYDERKRNVVVYRLQTDMIPRLEDSVILSTEQAKELGLSYKDLCIAHGIKKLKKSEQFVKVHHSKMRNKVQEEMKRIMLSRKETITKPF